MFKFLIGFIVFMSWALWVRYVYVCEIRHLCQEEIFADSSRSVTTGLRIDRHGEIINGQGQFIYTLASNKLNFTPRNRSFLNRLSSYLKPNPQLHLQIMGRYTHAEKDVPAGMYENIGLARAALLRDSLVKYYQVKPDRLWIQAEIVEDTDPEAAKAPDEPVSFLIARGNKLPVVRYDFTDMTFSEANFKKGGVAFTPKLPFIIYVDSLKSYVRQNPDYSIAVVTYVPDYTLDQQSKAQARAEAVKNYLIRTKGIRTRMLTSTKIRSKKEDAAQSLTIQIHESN